MVFGFSSHSTAAAAASVTAPAAPVKNFHVPASDETSTDLYCPLPMAIPWRMAGANWITEAQSYYLIDRTGKLIFLQVAWSNLSWPAQTTVQISSRMFSQGGNGKELDRFQIAKDACLAHSSHNCSASKLKLTENRLSLTVKNVSFQQAGKHYQLSMEREGRRGFGCSLTFTPLTDSFQCHDGSVHFGINRRDGFINLRFMPAARIQGHLEDEKGQQIPIDGLGMCLHQFQGVKPYLSASRWNMVYFQADTNEETILYMIQMTTPKIYQRQTHSVGYLFLRGQMVAITRSNLVCSEGNVKDPESNYLLPSKLRYQWSGVTLAPCRPFKAECRVELVHLAAKIAVLDTLPFVIRKVVEAFVAKPFVYQWLERMTVDLEIGEEKHRLCGWSFHEVSLISEDADSDPKQ